MGPEPQACGGEGEAQASQGSRGGADQLQRAQGWTRSLHVVRGLAKNELNPSSPNGINLPRGSFSALPRDLAKFRRQVWGGPTRGVYLFSPSVFLGPANRPHGSLCRAWKCAGQC